MFAYVGIKNSSKCICDGDVPGINNNLLVYCNLMVKTSTTWFDGVVWNGIFLEHEKDTRLSP